MNINQQIAYLEHLARDGQFGTPENPNRGSSGKAWFWNCFFGIKNAKQARGTLGYPYAKAGEFYRLDFDDNLEPLEQEQ